uniref:ATP synthase F0 subunit 8 n=1 Tax=Capitonius sp. QL-2013 TaxID=1421593 RepID=A0A0A6ZKU1_9HYME|nr:ATP synthase F0 subunit 8 [Capitonius sp. QL-2013]
MPQMSPMDWFMLMIYFFFIYYFSLIYIYFLYKKNIKLENKFNKEIIFLLKWY